MIRDCMQIVLGTILLSVYPEKSDNFSELHNDHN